MYPAYHAAIDAVQGIVDNTALWLERQENSNDFLPKGNAALYGFANNAIAFCGTRGQGKTSTMISFANALGFSNQRPKSTSAKNATESESNVKGPLADLLKDRRFYILPPIDPTMLAEGRSVIELVLTSLFTEFNNLWNSENSGNHRKSNDDIYVHSYANPAIMQEANKYDILRTFQKCRDGIQAERTRPGTSGVSDFDAFEQSGDIFTLKANLHKIIRSLFSLRGWDRDKSFLVIELDDTDMHLDNAYSIMEDVRKYLSIPNTVVLMAVDLGQLRALVNRHYRERLYMRDHIDGTDIGFNFDFSGNLSADNAFTV